MRTSPLEVKSGHPVSDTEQMAANLNIQIAELERMLRTETKRRNEVSDLLPNADREHDELRDVVKRLNKERDTAVSDLKAAKEAVPNTEVRNPVIQRSLSRSSQDQQHVIEEERDAAIRELYRVRKGLNKELRLLKKERAELVQKLEDGPSEEASVALRSQLSGSEAQREKVEGELDSVKGEIEDAKKQLTAEREATAAEAGKLNALRETLKTREEELRVLTTTPEGMEASLSTNEEKNHMKVQQLEDEKESFQKQVEAARNEISEAQSRIREREEQLNEPKRQVNEQVAQLETERAHGDSLTEKLSAESSARISAEKHVSEMESDLRRVGQRVVELESVEKKLRSDGKAMSEERKTLQAGTDESELERNLQRLGESESAKAHLIGEVKGLKARIAASESSLEELRRRTRRSGGRESVAAVGARGYEGRGDAPEEAELDAAVDGGRGGADDVQRPGGVGRALADTGERGAAAQSVEGAGGVGGGEERTQRGGKTDAVDETGSGDGGGASEEQV
ncbi:chromosome segregation protein SMC [Gracilaria domingensis]|nr:chromosome segregation protein SMC [Gracilaria domingensis]